MNKNTLKRKVITIILGGGKGTRLLPLTEKRSKPAVGFGGKYRLVDIPISNALNSGFDQIYVLTQFNSYSLNRHISRTYGFQSVHKQGFVEIIAAEQTTSSVKWFEGTADAVRKVMPHLEGFRPEYVMILSGDQLYNMDLNQFMEIHLAEEDTDMTIAANVVPPELAHGLGIIRQDSTGRAVDFYEKPQNLHDVESFRLPDGRFLASMGIYFFKASVLHELLEDPTLTDFGKEIIPDALKTKKIKVFTYDGYWEDIGTIKSFFNANLMLTDNLPRFNLYIEETPFYTRARSLPPTKVNKSNLSHVLLSEGCIINDSTITRAVIGVRQVINPGCNIENSLVMGADSYGTFDKRGMGIPVGVGRNCEIRNTILDKDCYIGENVKLLNKQNLQEYEDEYLRIVDGIIVVPRRSVVPNGYEI
ncbi:MAG TPA: sugar phosphate nucleotidyltransferase [Leptospiraceae bacterium]|nr:sugar phosphate nucleotidyltransferase [Leptospiraceae bacterium]HMZ58118.1 sugar phosphate nucleotidyltransferase [Leptospiraceae bacterium]HNF15385.1 sugar phosphate nucleotidyltransferase [Leptospiraceae bacterium]HNM05338.1 sugar phosphate nucleotidyltransferase [Leptospiraceae bacterium]HNN05087.1 sugar phosphate nucleotidyltransferase [Leptospiraceae bacterium]